MGSQGQAHLALLWLQVHACSKPIGDFQLADVFITPRDKAGLHRMTEASRLLARQTLAKYASVDLREFSTNRSATSTGIARPASGPAILALFPKTIPASSTTSPPECPALRWRLSASISPRPTTRPGCSTPSPVTTPPRPRRRRPAGDGQPPPLSRTFPATATTTPRAFPRPVRPALPGAPHNPFITTSSRLHASCLC